MDKPPSQIEAANIAQPEEKGPSAQQGSSLHYGDLIYLHVESVEGNLSSTGFSNANVFVQKYNFGTDTFCRNSRDFVFQIQPKFNFDARKDYRQAVKFYEVNVASKQETNNNPDKKNQGKQIDPQEVQKQLAKQAIEQATYKKKIALLKKKMVDEIDTNQKVLERRKGEFVTYGSEIQLYHQDSRMYLCGKKTCADIEKTCNKVELVEKLSAAIYFKILPRYKYRQEGEKIKYGDQIIFLNTKLSLYLHVADAQIPIERPITLPLVPGTTKNEITPVIIDRRCPPINYIPTYEVNVATTFSRFKAVQFCDHADDDDKFVKGGSVIKLRHSELGGLLSSDDNDFTDDGLAEVFLWVYRGKEDDVENFNTASLFEIEMAVAENRGMIARASDDPESEHKYRFRHLNTGRLCTVQDIMFNGQMITTLGLAEHLNLVDNPNPSKPGDNYVISDTQQRIKDLEDNTLFRLISTTVDKDSRVKDFSCVKIQHCKSQLYLSMKKRSLFIVEKKNQDHTDDNNEGEEDNGEFHGKLYQPLEDEDINFANRHVIELKPQAGYEDAFFIQILDHETLKDIMFVHTSVGILKKNIPFLCDGTKEIPKERFNEMDHIMKMLDAFSQCTESKVHGDSGGDGGEDGASSGFDMNTLKDKIIRRQKIMRELYLVEYIVQILYFPFATKNFNLMKITQEELITRLCKNAYVLLKNAVGGYEINEMYASQWINFFFTQAMNTNKDNDIFAQSTVEELLSDNTKLLNEQITPAIIKQFITLCKQQGKDKKLIKLLTALCTCYGDAVEHNQMHIVKYMLEDKETREKLSMPIRLRESQVEVRIEGNAFISLSMLEDFSKSRDEGRVYKYFKSLIDLSANLCIGRNIIAYQQLNPILSFDSVFQVILDMNLPYDLKSCFLQLINSMHLDREPVEALVIPTTTVVMNEIPSPLDFIHSADSISYPIRTSRVNIPANLMKLKDFVLNFIRTEQGVQNVEDTKKNKFVYNMILSLIFMLKHGFYKDQDELNSIALPLIMLLDGSDDVYVGGDEHGEDASLARYKYTQANEIILMSKKIQCDCLIFISQLELDGRAELYLAKLKRDYERQNSADQSPNRKDISKILKIGEINDQLPQIKGRSQDIASLDQLKGSLSLGLMNAITKHKSKTDSEKLRDEDPSGLLSQQNVEFLDTVASMKGFEQEIGDIYVCILFDLMLYHFPELNMTAFELLIRFFNRKATLLDVLGNIQILESTKSIDILNKVKSYKQQLSTLQADADMYMNQSDKSSKEQKTRVGEIQSFLSAYCSVLNKPQKDSSVKSAGIKLQSMFGKRNSQGLEQEEPEKLEDLLLKLKDEQYVRENLKPDDDSISPEQEEYIMYISSPYHENKENQRIMRSFAMEQFAVYFIHFRTEEKDALVPEHVFMIKQCYRFLIKYVHGNIQNQTKLRDHLDDFLKDIDKHPLAIQLVYEIFKDNRKFLNMSSSKIFKTIVNASEKADINESRKGSLYKVLQVFCRHKDKLVRANQQDVIVYMSVKGPQSSILYLFTSEGFADFSKYIKLQKQVVFPNEEELLAKANPSGKKNDDPSQSNPTIFVTNPIMNIISCIELMSLCCEGKSDLAEQKCQNEILTLENTFKILEACEYFWPLKKILVDYLWQCFLDTNIKTVFSTPNESNVKLIWQIGEIILNDMINIIDNFNKESDKDVYIKYPYKPATTLRSESVSFLTDSIFIFFKQLMKRTDILIDSEGEPIITVFAKQVVIFYYACVDVQIKKKAYKLLSYMYGKPHLSRFLDNLKHPLIGVHPGTLNTQESVNKKDKYEKDQVLETVNFENSQSSKLSQMLSQVQKSEEVHIFVEKEFEELVLWITNVELRVKDIMKTSTSHKEASFENLTFASIISALLQMLDKRELSKQLHLIGLQIVRKLIEVENKDLITPSAEWDTEDYIEFKGNIVAKQDAMIEIGTVQFLCKHISELEDDALLEQCVLIGISLLIGGNKKGQEAFLNYFMEQDDSNRVLTKLKHMLLKEFDQAKIYLQEKNAKLTRAVKNQDKAQQAKQKKTLAKGGDKQLTPENEVAEQFGLDQPLDRTIEEEEDPYDHTLENLMTIENSENGVSMITDNGAAPEVAEAKPKKDEDGEAVETNDNSASLRRATRILRLLQLFVEGHYSPMQDHIREQRNTEGQINPKSFDFVAFISTMLGVYEKQYVNQFSCEMGFQMLDTLIELVQGPCKENQRTLVSSKVIDNCRDFLGHGTSERECRIKGFIGDQAGLVDELKSKSVILMNAIIEGPIDQEIMKSMMISLDDFAVIFERLNQVFLDFVKSVLNLDPDQVEDDDIQNALVKDSFDEDAIQEGFGLFVLIRTLADSSDKVRAVIGPYQEFPSYKFFNRNTGYIEILLDPETLQRVYFPIKPVCKYLSAESRRDLMIVIDRSSPQEKILGLLKAVPELVDEMEHIEVLSRATIQITPERLAKLRDFSNLLSLAICTLMVCFYEYGVQFDENGLPAIGPIIPQSGAQLAIKVAGYLQMIVACALLIGQLITRAHLVIKSNWRAYVEENRFKYQNLLNSNKDKADAYSVIKAKDLSLLDARMLLLTQGPDANEFMIDDCEDEHKRDFGHVILRLEYIWTSSSFVLSNGTVVFLIIYCALSILGLFLSPIFYSMQLLDVINRFPALQNVIKAISMNGNQLIQAAALEFTIIWIYCVIIFTFFFDHMYDDNIQFNSAEKGDSACYSLFHCYFSCLDYGLRSGGGIGDFLPPNSYFNDSKVTYYLRLFHDLIFFLVVIITFFNIIFGIIIDTFGSLRESNNDMMEDMRNVCFICGIERQDIDKDSEIGYVEHIKQEHNLWQYVFFIIHLNTKDETDYNGTESFVVDKLESEDISWFPFNKAICLEKESYMIGGDKGDKGEK